MEEGEAEQTARGDTEPREAAPALAAGTLVGGRYRVRRLLGRGGMGAVYEAEHEAIGRRVALKVLRADVSDASYGARFVREARLANQVRHRNVVEVTDFGDDQGMLYLVMELLEGETLGAVIARGVPCAPAEAVDLLVPVLDALAHLHDRGVVHRDLKPENVFLARVAGEPEPVPRVLDFGIARQGESARVTRTGTLLGTPLYMSPEQCRGDRAVTEASDQYSAAAMLYELVTGRTPHEAPTVNLLLVAKLTLDAIPVRDWRPELPEAFAAVVDRALRSDPAQRYGSVRELRDALLASFDAVDEGPAASARAAATVEAPPRASAPLASVPPPSPPPRRVAVAFGVVALAAAALWWTVGRSPTTPRAAVSSPRAAVLAAPPVVPAPAPAVAPSAPAIAPSPVVAPPPVVAEVTSPGSPDAGAGAERAVHAARHGIRHGRRERAPGLAMEIFRESPP